MIIKTIQDEGETESISTYKETLIYKMLKKGVSVKDISEILNISEQIVHQRRIKQ